VKIQERRKYRESIRKLEKASADMADALRSMSEASSDSPRFFKFSSLKPDGSKFVMACAIDDRTESLSEVLNDYMEQILDEDEKAT